MGLSDVMMIDVTKSQTCCHRWLSSSRDVIHCPCRHAANAPAHLAAVLLMRACPDCTPTRIMTIFRYGPSWVAIIQLAELAFAMLLIIWNADAGRGDPQLTNPPEMKDPDDISVISSAWVKKWLLGPMRDPPRRSPRIRTCKYEVGDFRPLICFHFVYIGQLYFKLSYQKP